MRKKAGTSTYILIHLKESFKTSKRIR